MIIAVQNTRIKIRVLVVKNEMKDTGRMKTAKPRII
jgi:hypothetical protein